MVGKLFGLVLLILIGVYVGFSWYVVLQMVKPFKNRIDISPNVISPNNETVTFTAADGIKLEGWFFKGSGARLAILVSGLLENRTNNGYYGGFIARDLLEKGYSVLVYDTRDFSTSSGKAVQYGATEGNDILGAVEFAKSKGFKESSIGIIGYSTGAVSILMVADKLHAVGALVSDSSAADYKKVLSGVLSREKHVPRFFHPAIFFLLKKIYHVDVESVRPIDTIRKAPERTFLFLHGKLDKTISVDDSVLLHKASNPNSKLVIFPKGEHIETYKSDPELYKKEVYGFLDQELEN